MRLLTSSPLVSRSFSFSRLSKTGGTTGLCATVLAVFLAAAALPTLLHAQEPDSTKQTCQKQTYRVETADGTVLVGTLVSKTETKVTLETRQAGTVTVKRSDIEDMKKLNPDRFRDGSYWFRNPQSTRYLFGTNAIGLPKGNGYYQNTWILFNNVNYGLSNNVSVGGGMIPSFLFGASAMPVWVLPKVSISTPRENFHLAGGAVLGTVIGDDGGGSAGLLYGVSTVGTRDHNATLGIGYGLANGELSNAPAVTLSGMTRLSQTVYLLSENYFFPAVDGFNVISVGVRWAPRNFAVDFGLFRPLTDEDTGDLVALPWLGVTIPFGQ